MSLVTTLFAPITQRSPIVTPLADACRALAGESLPCHRPLRVVEAVVGVGYEAAVGEHAVVSDLDQPDRGHHHRDVEEGAGADPDAGLVGRGQPHVGLQQGVLADHEPSLAERLEHVAVQRPACERPAASELAVNPDPVPGQRVALVPAPLLPPELGVPHGRQLPRDGG
jgi:hypothetical protein